MSMVFIWNIVKSAPIFFWFAAPLAAQDLAVNATSLEGAYQHALRTLERYPPDQYYIINWGENTALLDTFMCEIIRAQNPSLVTNYVQYMPLKGVADAAPGSFHRALLHLIPKAKELGGRKIVFNRVLMTGHTARASAAELAGALRQQGYTEATMSFLIGHKQVSTRGAFDSPYGINFEIDMHEVARENWDYVTIANQTWDNNIDVRSGRLQALDLGAFHDHFTAQTPLHKSKVQTALRKKVIPEFIITTLRNSSVSPLSNHAVVHGLIERSKSRAAADCALSILQRLKLAGFR